MHICHLILTHTFAGSERYAIELANAQAEFHQVSLILHKKGCESRSSALLHRVSNNVTVYQVSGPKWLASFQARRLLSKIQPDIAHAHLSAACKALRNLHGPVRVASLHIHYKSSQHAHLDGLIAIAPWQLEAIPSQLRNHSTQIDNWTQAAVPSADARQRLRQSWSVQEEDFVIGTLGRIEPSKGHELLLRAFARLNAQHTKLVIVGGGSSLAKLQSQAPANVIFTGYTAEPQNCFAAFDGFVSAAYSEPFGLVFLEAMTARLPMVATASQGADYLQDYFLPPLTEPGHEDGLADALARLVARGKEPVDYDMARFDYKSRVADITLYYQELMDTLHKERT